MRKPRYADPRRPEPLGDVMGGRLPLDRSIDGEHHLLDGTFANALDELPNRKVFRAYTFCRRQRAAEHVIEAAPCACALKRPQVSHLLHHADDRLVATGII